MVNAENTPAEEILLDIDHLEKVSFGDAELERQVLGIFLEQAALFPQLLRQTSAPVELADHIHRLKGSSRGIGAVAIGNACSKEEEAARQGQAVAVEELLQLLERTCVVIRQRCQ
ncbi:Hpt domain-containing protein [Pseudovibrio flavus]|uniref:Hpt domain-containing protein n=1 Tax=Pseudovibrio flavus TaxID=2529854 RepID=UPI00211CCC08|nr:Hpt domain-containing protein [Pseudovibrio flavus]